MAYLSVSSLRSRSVDNEERLVTEIGVAGPWTLESLLYHLERLGVRVRNMLPWMGRSNVIIRRTQAKLPAQGIGAEVKEDTAMSTRSTCFPPSLGLIRDARSHILRLMHRL